MKLDIGTGSKKHHKIIQGVLNTDVQKTEDNKAILDCLCDAQHLPFRDNVFANVRISHVAEHLENPILAFKEALRVLEPMGQLKIVVPHRLSHFAKQKSEDMFMCHKWSFTPEWFRKAFMGHHITLHVRYTPWGFMGVRVLGWILSRPTEIVVIVTKVEMFE